MSRDVVNSVILTPTLEQELITAAEVAAFKYPETREGVELHAPFADFGGVKRPVIVDRSVDLTTKELCRVSLSMHAFHGHEIRLNAKDGKMGRPVYSLDGFGSFESGFGDDDSKETYTGFALYLAMDGTASFLATSEEFTEPQELGGLTLQDIYKFGRAVLGGINDHYTKS